MNKSKWMKVTMVVMALSVTSVESASISRK